MTIALGRVDIIFFRHLLLKRTIGNNKVKAPTFRNRVSEIGLMTPATLSEARNEPATSIVASITSK